ncbi:hypothetical protein SPRG_21627 [Saprolegnia parasitica CBS 223.65]|uniref:ApaG domain-containing protein n=1 Tax=Saprolegnia parasitica (strain CBS 223.65) TaxID=695850 RepID=A0A067BWC8_SAPPC|nr:hypothetical protein SPRG_21627 [Saprolegnia parasitica CBS 223.65]KDO18912.1 hypothetical protein SPRG_21627 [Saprolegnia parasitica CBS 223.65]|eukprot:XP_012210382.1 hypothetical protein SPRG_21627 [Saprolegnia parasitica CBS 223.65]
MRPRTIRALYKVILRDVRKMSAIPGFRVREPLSMLQWGTGGMLPPPEDGVVASPYASPEDKETWVRLQALLEPHRGADLRDVVRATFRANATLTDPKTIAQKIDEMMWVIPEISRQRLLAESSSVTCTDDVEIEATSQFLPTQSEPNRFRYTYRIRIRNLGEDIVRVNGRHWVFNHNSVKRDVLPRNSPGVVGHIPVIAPGHTFEYASGVDLETTTGSASGCLHMTRFMATDDGGEVEFDAEIASFLLQPTVSD